MQYYPPIKADADKIDNAEARLPDDAKIITTIGVMRHLMRDAAPPRAMGCICPGDATPFCQNQFCPRKPVPNTYRV